MQHSIEITSPDGLHIVETPFPLEKGDIVLSTRNTYDHSVALPELGDERNLYFAVGEVQPLESIDGQETVRVRWAGRQRPSSTFAMITPDDSRLVIPSGAREGLRAGTVISKVYEGRRLSVTINGINSETGLPTVSRPRITP